MRDPFFLDSSSPFSSYPEDEALLEEEEELDEDDEEELLEDDEEELEESLLFFFFFFFYSRSLNMIKPSLLFSATAYSYFKGSCCLSK